MENYIITFKFSLWHILYLYIIVSYIFAIYYARNFLFNKKDDGLEKFFLNIFVIFSPVLLALIGFINLYCYVWDFIYLFVKGIKIFIVKSLFFCNEMLYKLFTFKI